MDIVPEDRIWDRIREEAERDAAAEPALAGFLNNVILSHETLEQALSFILASKLDSNVLTSLTLRDLLCGASAADSVPARAQLSEHSETRVSL